MSTFKTFNWKGIFIWSNHFYGICAAGLTIESNFILLHKIPGLSIVSFVYLATVLYYSQAYLKECKEGVLNERAIWYQKNFHYLLLRQFFLLFLLVYIGIFKLHLIPRFLHSSIGVKGIFISTLLISIFYYYPLVFKHTAYSFRKIGFLKSFSIAWVWTIICLFLPNWLTLNVDFSALMGSLFFWLYFLSFLVYIFILAMLLDMKDALKDQEDQVNTIVVQLGKHRTITLLLIPLLLLYVAMNGLMTYQKLLSLNYLALQSLLALTTYLIAKRIVHVKSIAANVLWVDGLLLLKAIFCFSLICSHFN